MLKDPFYCGFILHKGSGRLYPHKYDRIISQELFDACQKVTEERSAKNNRKQSIQTAKEGKEFIFKSLVKCGTTGRIVTCDRKDKGRIKTSTYLMPWDPENPKKKLWVNENEILTEIEKVFKSMEFPKEMLAEVQEKLQGAHNSEKDYYKNKINELNNRLGIAHAKLDRLVDMKLTDSITEDMFAKKRTEIEKEIATLKTDVAMHDIADEKFKTLVVTVFSLASEAHELFLYSTMSERRSFIDYVFSDITLTGKKLSYSLRCPFDLMVNIASRQDWLPTIGKFRTHYFEALKTINRPCEHPKIARAA